MPDRPDPDHPAQGLAHSIGWFAIAQMLSVVLTFGSAMVMARLLGPKDYAVMAIIAPTIGAVQTIQGLGLGSAIIRAEALDKRVLDALFRLVMGFSIVLCLIVALAGPVLAWRLTGLHLDREFAFAAFAILTSALGLQSSSLMARALRFKSLAMLNMISNAVGVGITLSLAMMLRNHWALLAAPVLVPLLNAILTARLVDWRPGRPCLSRELGPMLHFGLRISATNLLTFASRNADNLIVAGFSTPYQLGIYERSCRILAYPLAQAVTPLGQVVVPTLTRDIGQPDLYRDRFWRVTGLLLLASLPGLAIATAFSTTLLGSLLGLSWLAGGPLFGWFAGAAMVEMIVTPLNWLMTSQGRGSDVFRSCLFGFVVALSSFVLGIQWGTLGVAIAFTVGRVALCLPYAIFRAGAAGLVRHAEMAGELAPHAAALAVAGGAVWAIRLGFGSPRWPMLIASLMCAYVLYAAVLMAIPPSRRHWSGR